MKKKIVVISPNYPNEQNQYGDVFVHSRLIHYLPQFDVQVLSYNRKADQTQYIYEGIKVEVVNEREKLKVRIKYHEPDILGFHFIEGWMVNKIVKHFDWLPMVVWIHGFEALGWYRRLFYLDLNLKSLLLFLRYICLNTLQMMHMKKLISYSNRTRAVNFIFVSNWMRKITEIDTFSEVKNYNIISNPIDTDRFTYVRKDEELRKKILLIRSFENNKYANDLAINAILKLSRNKEIFDSLEFAIYGKGKLFNKLTKKVKKFRNVAVVNEFIENKSIPSLHKNYGIFLSPTRQDAQGVSMCEAMSSGLVVITSRNTAIPEFVNHDVTGFLTESADDIAKTIEHLYRNPQDFLRISEEASISMKKISSTSAVIKGELKLLNSLLKKN